MAINEKACKALSATRALDIPDEEVKPVLRQLLKVFDNNWEPIEAEDYRALIDAYFELKENKEMEDKTKGVMELDGSGRPSNKLLLGGQEQASSTMDNSSQISALEELRKKRKDRISSHESPQERKSISDRTSCAVRFKQPMYESGSSHSRRENVPSSHCNKKLVMPRTERSIDDSSHFPECMSKVHPGPDKRASRNGNGQMDSIKSGSNCSGRSNSCNLVNDQQRPITCDQKRPVHRIDDLTNGAENVKIPLVDEIGNEDLPEFFYLPQNIIYQNAYVHISMARVADEDCCTGCSGDCLSLLIPCACARETGGEFAYTQQGVLKEEFLRACISMKQDPHKHPFVYCQDCPLERIKNEYLPEPCKGHLVREFIKECWRKCKCHIGCGNRVVQRGITCKLQVFLTHEGKGWGLKTLQDLPKGTFVCEYVGEILTNMELYERNMQGSGIERHTYPVTLDADWGSEKVLRDEEALCLDATQCGNVARFINHRCFDANLIDIPVEVETPDRHYYHLAFFTSRDVHASEELTWDYGIDFNDHYHPIKAFQCRCGSAFCQDVNKKGKGLMSSTLR